MKIKELKPAEYNPRKITDEQLARLKKSLNEFGDLSGIVFNRRTGNLISGHQRIKCLPPDAVIEKKELETPTSNGTVAEGFIHIPSSLEKFSYREVDWPIEKEKAANIAANKHGGEFDDESLEMLIEELTLDTDFDCDLIGFDQSEIDSILKGIDAREAQQERRDARLKEKIHELYEVVIECASEREQEQVFRKIKKEGYKCRLLTL